MEMEHEGTGVEHRSKVVCWWKGDMLKSLIALAPIRANIISKGDLFEITSHPSQLHDYNLWIIYSSHTAAMDGKFALERSVSWVNNVLRQLSCYGYVVPIY